MSNRWIGVLAFAALTCSGWLARPAAAGQPGHLNGGSGAAPGHESAATAG